MISIISMHPILMLFDEADFLCFSEKTLDYNFILVIVWL